MKQFGVTMSVANKKVIRLRYTDHNLAIRVVKYLSSKGYSVNRDFIINEYLYKGKLTTKLEGILNEEDLLYIMIIKQRRVAEIALQKEIQLSFNIY